MQLSDKDKKYILESFLETIAGISDKEYQIRVWLHGDPKIFDTYDETYCNFFGDGDPLLKNYRDFGLTEKQHSILKEFRDEFYVFSRNYNSAEEFIDTPEWAKIMEMAKDVMKAFNYKKPW